MWFGKCEWDGISILVYAKCIREIIALLESYGYSSHYEYYNYDCTKLEPSKRPFNIYAAFYCFSFET